MSDGFDKDALIKEIELFIATKVPGFSVNEHMDSSFSHLGLDSADHVRLTTIVEDLVNLEVEPTLAFDYPTVNSLVGYVEKNIAHTSDCD